MKFLIRKQYLDKLKALNHTPDIEVITEFMMDNISNLRTRHENYDYQGIAVKDIARWLGEEGRRNFEIKA